MNPKVDDSGSSYVELNRHKTFGELSSPMVDDEQCYVELKRQKTACTAGPGIVHVRKRLRSLEADIWL